MHHEGGPWSLERRQAGTGLLHRRYRRNGDEGISFADGREDFESLLDAIKKAGSQIPVGMEATGHYGEPLKRFLAADVVPYARSDPSAVLSFAKATSKIISFRILRIFLRNVFNRPLACSV